MTAREPDNKPRLLRVLGFWTLMIYGVGDILGAGIYALIGEVAGLAGSLSWVSFLIAVAVAGLTGFSYAELGRRFPYSGGETCFCEQAFHRPLLSFLVGWLVFCSGLVSIATLSRAFAGYFTRFAPEMPEPVVVIGFVFVLAAIAVVGIRISSSVNILCTFVESSGLLLVMIAGLVWLTGGEAAPAETPVSTIEPTAFSIIQAATLAFFAFIGFEDMVNVAEEVRDPERTLPRALLAAIGITGVMYLMVVLIATSVVAPAILAESDAPLLEVLQTGLPQFPRSLFAVIALFAMANTGLANFVTSSRLIYGMSEQRLLPTWLGRISRRTRTPHAAISACFVVGMGLAVSGTLAQLAGATSCLLLLVFAAMNLSLATIQKREVTTTAGRISTARRIIPCVAGMFCLALLFFVPVASLLTAGCLIAVGIAVGLTQMRRTTA